MKSNDISPAHMQNIFENAKENYLQTFTYVTPEEYDQMVTDYFRSHYSRDEVNNDLPIEECWTPVRKAYLTDIQVMFDKITKVFYWTASAPEELTNENHIHIGTLKLEDQISINNARFDNNKTKYIVTYWKDSDTAIDYGITKQQLMKNYKNNKYNELESLHRATLTTTDNLTDN